MKEWNLKHKIEIGENQKNGFSDSATGTRITVLKSPPGVKNVQKEEAQPGTQIEMIKFTKIVIQLWN
jgi:hypothetical protein